MSALSFVQTQIGRRLSDTVLAIVAAIGGGAFFFGGLRGLWLGWQSRTWPIAIGLVQESKIDGDVDGRYVAVSYAYTVQGSQYISSRVSFGGGVSFFSDLSSFFSPSAAERVANQFEPGRKVRVYYDPVAPHKAVLKPGMYLWSLVAVVMGFIVFLVGVVIIGDKIGLE